VPKRSDNLFMLLFCPMKRAVAVLDRVSQNCDHEDCCLLGCNSVQSEQSQPAFRGIYRLHVQDLRINQTGKRKHACLAYSQTLKMEYICSSETSLLHRDALRYIPKDRTLHVASSTHCCLFHLGNSDCIWIYKNMCPLCEINNNKMKYIDPIVKLGTWLEVY
jgi:hypothetical protein